MNPEKNAIPAAEANAEERRPAADQKAADKKKEAAARNESPKRSILEEVGNAVTHGVGALFSIAGLILLLLRSDTGLKVFCSVVYGTCLILMFLMSCLYHSFKWGSGVKRLWRRFDYISIYLLIGGTFTPLWLLLWGGGWGTGLCIAQWAVLITGIVLIAVFGPGRPKALHTAMYIVMGWCGLVFLPRLARENLPLLISILAGGVIYTVGIIPFARKARGAHFIWHFFVFFGALVHFLGILLFLY